VSAGSLFYLADRSLSVQLSTPGLDETRTFRILTRRVIDGDTFVADMALGYGGLVATERRMRFAGGNARGTRGAEKQPGGPEAALNLAGRLRAGFPATVRLVSETADPHGRLLVTVRLDDGTDLVEELIAQQWLAPWDGRGEPPLPPWPRTVA
jgi:endonuclease YncB( thermonuclease family)